MPLNNQVKRRLILWLSVFMYRNALFMFFLFCVYMIMTSKNCRNRRACSRQWSLLSKLPTQIKNLRELTALNDQTCINNLRMDRNSFLRLCYLLENMGGLHDERFVTVHEKVACFLLVLSHHTKNMVVKHNFKRSGYTVSKYFNETLRAVMKVSSVLLVELHPVLDDSQIEPWKYFKGCLGALDGTYIEVRVKRADQPRYRSRKGIIAVNVLGVCNCELNFVYVLSGWEGSAADSRVLRDALSRPHGLRVPRGNYYLCDAGYTNCEGFLTPYRGTRYHLDDWRSGPNAPQNAKEFFNLKHAKARNVIERAFGVLKSRWAILRSPNFYPIKKQNLIILACALLHNFIRSQMDHDPFEEDLPEETVESDETTFDPVDTIETSIMWTAWRDDLAANMYTQWRGRARG